MRLLACLIVAPQRATMSQQSSLTQSPHSVRQVLTAYSIAASLPFALSAHPSGRHPVFVSYFCDMDVYCLDANRAGFRVGMTRGLGSWPQVRHATLSSVLDWQFSRFLALENPPGVGTDPTNCISETRV